MNNQNHSKPAVIIWATFLCAIYMLPSIAVAQIPEFELVRSHKTEFVDAIISDIDHDGYSDVLFRTYFYGRLEVMYGKPDGSLEAPVYTGAGASSMAVGFINEDTLLDIVSSSVYYAYILINEGNRAFSIDSIYQGYVNWGGIILGYFNDDTYLDFVASYDKLHLNDGTGQFTQTINMPFYGQTVHVSDFNNDGIDDILAIDAGGNGGIYLNDGEANFAKVDSFAFGGGGTLGSTIDNPIVDFDRDGNVDFAFITPQDYGVYSNITIGYTNHDGTIRELDTLVCSGTAYSLAISDLNNDNFLDIIAADVTNYILVLYFGLPEGGFSDSVHIPNEVNVYPWALSCGDIDRDGNTDLISGDLYSDSVNVFINLSDDKPVLEERMLITGNSNINLNIINPGNLRISKNYRTVAGSDYWRLDADNNQTIDEKAVDYNAQYGEYTLILKTKPDAETGSKFSADIKIGNKKAILFKDYETPELIYTKNGRLVSDSLIFYYTLEEVSSIQPANGGMAMETPTFDWSGMVEPLEVDTYQFQLDRYYDFRSPIYDINDLALPTYTPPAALGLDSVFYWRFRVFDGVSWSEFSHTFAAYVVNYICGDVNGNAITNIFDITHIISFLYLGGPPPANMNAADINSDGLVNIFDAIVLIEYLYLNGPAPDCP